MFANSDELLKFISDEGVEMVDVRFCDLPGVMQHFTVPVSSFDQSVFDDGLNFDGSSVRGFQAIHESDMSLFPDPTTAYLDPFRDAKTLVVNFFIHDPLTGEAYSRDPRNIARKAQAYLASTGIGDTAYSRPRRSSTSSTRCGSRPGRTPVSTTSTPRRVPGTPAPRTTTAATR
jgi:glutamine synthetase